MMTNTITINKEVTQDNALSYDFLREEGIKIIQQLAATTWTDHNIHDPGITILEQLCFAITDLAYRIDDDIENLLGSEDQSTYEDLYSAATILTVNPVTLLDMRKLIIDQDSVKNAWIEKVAASDTQSDPDTINPKGLYRVFLEKDSLSEVASQNVVANVSNQLNAHRGVCEDFEEITVLDAQLIRLEGTIEVSDTIDDLNLLVANILCSIDWLISPRVRFYTLQELLAEGKRTDEIFDGPPLQHGFIKEEELLQFDRKKEIQISDVIREIMDQAGVLTIDKLALATGVNTLKNWVLPLDQDKAPRFDFEATLRTLQITSNGLAVTIDQAAVSRLFYKKRVEGLPRQLSPNEYDIILPEKGNPTIENYYSIQNQFPINYGIGDIGLPASASTTRKAQAKQLTAYLTLFEQLLANQFSQVANFKKLMSFDSEESQTYFNQSLLERISGLKEVLKSKESYEAYLQENTADTANGLQRKNKFLNHLLARFAEKFTGYGMLLEDLTGVPQATDKKLIRDKATFLKEYPSISAGRGKGIDYTQPFDQSKNSSGLIKRIALKLGIETSLHEHLGEDMTDGFHMIEHILLRPRAQYPYPFDVSYGQYIITGFEPAINTAHTKCLANGHDLKKGEEIQIVGPEAYQGIYTIAEAEEGYFEIEVPFQATDDASFWQRRPDMRYYLKTKTIAGFEVAPETNNTIVKSITDQLQIGDRIELTQTQHYDGIHEIVAITATGFELAIPFQEGENAGRWMPISGPKDPFSLQLTFALPAWIERYKNPAFKKFVEHTIREETPVHLTTHIQWLDQNDMKAFDQAMQTFFQNIQ